MIVYYACIFLFDFTCFHAICLLVLVNSDAHIGPGVINLEILDVSVKVILKTHSSITHGWILLILRL